MRKSPSCHTCAEYVCKMYSFVYSGSRQHDTKYAGSFLDQTTVRTLLTDRAFQCNSAIRDHLWRSEAAASRDAGVTLQCSFGIQHVSTACTCCDFLFSLDAPFQLFFFFFHQSREVQLQFTRRGGGFIQPACIVLCTYSHGGQISLDLWNLNGMAQLRSCHNQGMNGRSATSTMKRMGWPQGWGRAV